jgi:hypothetical protein
MFSTVILNHKETIEILVLIFSKTKEIYDNFRHSNFTHIVLFFFLSVFISKSNFS